MVTASVVAGRARSSSSDSESSLATRPSTVRRQLPRRPPGRRSGRAGSAGPPASVVGQGLERDAVVPGREPQLGRGELLRRRYARGARLPCLSRPWPCGDSRPDHTASYIGAAGGHLRHLASCPTMDTHRGEIERRRTPHSSSGRDGQRPQAIVVHTTDGGFAASAAWFASAESGVSAHYLVGLDGRVAQFVDEADTARHAGRVLRPTAALAARPRRPEPDHGGDRARGRRGARGDRAPRGAVRGGRRAGRRGLRAVGDPPRPRARDRPP